MATPQLIVRAPDGRVRVVGSTSVGRFFGQIAIGGAGTPQSGSIVDARFSEGRPFYFLHLDGTVDPEGYLPTVSISGNTLTWTYRAADANLWQRPVAVIIYGSW